MRRLAPALTVSGLVLLAHPGCGSNGSPGNAGEVGTYESDAGPAFSGGDAGASSGLDAHIEENRVTVTVVTVGCAGDCADVEAVATGGYPPYTFSWDDGSTSPSRRVCPTVDASYVVNVTDTGRTGELARPAETVRAPLMANVLACSDAGSAGVCISNPSFEGTPWTSGLYSFVMPGWTACPPATGTPDVLDATVTGVTPDGVSLPAPSRGATYVGLVDNKNVANAYVAQDLCTPVPAGASRSFQVDAARVSSLASSLLTSDATNGFLQVWGGTGVCSAGDSAQSGALLWTSPELQTSWQTYCVTITPKQAMTSIAFRALADYATDSATEVLVDNIVPVAACP